MEGFSLRVPKDVINLYNDPTVKRLLRQIVEPVQRSGIDQMVFREGDHDTEAITKDDAPSFFAVAAGADPDERVLTTNTSTTALRLIAPNFDIRKSKWRFHDGDAVKWYGIDDETFLREVRDNVRRFGSGDYLICIVDTVQRIGNDGRIEVYRSISRVLEQRVAGQQSNFWSS